METKQESGHYHHVETNEKQPDTTVTTTSDVPAAELPHPIIKSLKRMRAHLKSLEAFYPTPSRESSLALTNMQQAMMHCGNTIKLLDGGNVYPTSTDPATTTIDPYHVDNEIGEIVFPEETKSYTRSQTMKFLRAEVESVGDEFLAVANRNPDMNGVLLFTVIYLYLVQSKNWLGMELGRIRDLKLEVANATV